MSEERRKEVQAKRLKTISSPEYKQEKRNKKALAECLKEIMNSNVDLSVLETLGVSPETIQVLSAMKGKTMTAQEAMVVGITIKAIKDQDVPSAVFIRDTMGEKAPEKTETSVTIEDYAKLHKPKM